MADTYTLKSGDTLGAIAGKFGMSLAQLLKLNPQIDTKAKNWDRKLKVGLQLKLKDAPPPPPPKQSGGPVTGKGGKGYRLNYENAGQPDEKIDLINPTSKFGRKASGVLKEKDWREGEEILDKPKPKPVETPVEIYTPPPPEEQGIPWYQKVGQAIKDANAPFPDVANNFGNAVGKIGERFGMSSGNAARLGREVSGLGMMGLTATGLAGPTGLSAAGTAASAPVRAIRTPPPTPAGGMRPAGHFAVESPVTNVPPPDITPTLAMRARTEAAIRAREGSIAKNPAFPKESWRQQDDLGGMSNVRAPDYPYEPALPVGGKPAGPTPPGLRERTIEAPEPLVVKASDMKTLDDVRGALRSASDNTVVIDGATDLGFVADRVMIVKGRGGRKINPEKVLDSYETPVLTQGMFATILKHIGFK